MTNTFFISDTHFGQDSILSFKRDDGSPVRPEFSCVEEMDEYMVEKWNSVVGPRDRIYHLGDITMKRKNLAILDRLNGRKKLVMGNHDIWKAKDLLKYFDDVMAVRVYPKHDIILSHFPIRSDSLWSFKKKRAKINVHGHIHWRDVKDEHGRIDPRYINVGVEKLNYTPIEFNEILKRIEIFRESENA